MNVQARGDPASNLDARSMAGNSRDYRGHLQTTDNSFRGPENHGYGVPDVGPDLSHLTDEERSIIESVMQKQQEYNNILTPNESATILKPFIKQAKFKTVQNKIYFI